MDERYYFYLVMILLLIGVCIFYSLVKKIKKGQNYLDVVRLNQLYSFNVIQKKIRICDNVSSLHSLNKLEPNEIIYFAIDSNKYGLKTELQKILMNRKKFYFYENKFNEIINEIVISKYRFGLFNKLLKLCIVAVCNSAKMEPTLDFTVYYNASYTSPAGRNHYEKNERYNYDDLVYLCSYYKSEERSEELRRRFIESERAKMSDSLRYKVLRRDDFKCKICGATADDGVKLHVDHIIPVSKGGKTELSNLQTLCERCNMGKSNKL